MELKSKLEKIVGKENLLIDENMSKHTTFKTGGKADYFIKINNFDCLKNTIDLARKNNIPLYIIGNGSNILVTDKGIRGIVCQIKLEKFEINKALQETRYTRAMIDEAQVQDVLVTIGSGNKNAEISQKLAKMEIEGFEFASRNSGNTSAGQ